MGSLDQLEESGHGESLVGGFTINLPASNKLSEAPEFIIVGQGIVGAALAAFLGRHGRRVLAIERSLEQPDRIVGELLQPGGVAKLEELGLSDCLEGIDAPTVTGYSIWFNKDILDIPYPVDANGVHPIGRSFHHGRFIQKLRTAAIEQKTVEVREGTVTRLLQNEKGDVEGVVYKTKEGSLEEVKAPLTIVCDGCFSALRKDLSKGSCQVKSHFVGLILKGQPPVANHGNVILSNPTPVLLYPIGSNEVRTLVDMPEMPRDRSLAEYLNDVIAPQIPENCRQAFIDAVNEGKARSMPNRILSAQPTHNKGVVLIGDALNMRHPLTGGGMTVAFTDVVNLGNLLKDIDLNDQAKVQKGIENFYSDRKKPASSINILATALYDVFSEKHADLREACFSYLSMGGFFCQGPISLLAGISRNDSFLLIHFFMVALYGVGRTILRWPSFSNIYKGYAMLRDAVHIIKPLAVAESPNPLLVTSCKLLSTVIPPAN